ncbi:Uncharacterised protein [Pseudomonas luteola]|uniref:Uncharacterized protein n=1 Tax=Pseudomonas luteola TaxID=47886 RepID=A0A2X2BYY1_PSELU|nr:MULTISPECIES: hypothetical protein [Pseudomonas]MBA1250176.1 hypothetical protein [Pseudomonas zeshuii]MBH3440927.1 hypothetical protein [Pseudomonas luteola]SPY99971.1 Uncharacterised protein [Pseudomonas luteola]
MQAMPRIGVALYENGSPFSRDGNVACEFRKQPFAFSSASELPGQTLWVTNVNLSSLIDAGLHRNPKIAHDGYYRTRIAQMSVELGLDSLPVEQRAAILSEILGDAAEMARLQLGLTQYPSYGLAQAVGQLHGPIEPPAGSAVARVAEQACQRYTACERDKTFKNPEIFDFWFPRFAYADDLLELPKPIDGNLKTVPPHMLPSMGQNVGELVDWATQNQLPLFARIKIQGLEETVGKLMNYGAGAQEINRSTDSGTGNYQARNMREWASLPELDMLSQVGDISVLQVAIAEGWSGKGLHLYHSRLSSISYAYGLVAENLWVGLTRQSNPSGRVARTLSTAWLQAIDRMRCLRVAERLHNLGMEIIHYGNGRIRVACPISVRALIPQIALEEGLLYPACLEGLTPYRTQSNNPTHVFQHLLNERDHGRIIRVDLAALKELEASVHALK